MPGGSTESVDKKTTENTQPWAPTIPGLTGAVNKLTGMSTDVTPGQTTALGNVTGALSGLQNFGGDASGLASKLFGSNTDASKGILSGAYSGLQNTLSPYMSSSYLNPMSTPGFSDALKTMNSDITNQVNGQFASAGRDMSPANSQALSRGLSQGEGQLISNQYNANVGAQQGAANNLFGAGANTASGLTGLDQTAVGNWLQGMGVAGQIPGLTAAPGMAQLGAATQAGQQPFQNMSWLTSGLLPIASMGSQGQGTTNGTVTKNTDPFSNVIGGVSGGLGTLGATGAFGNAGWLAPMLAGL